MYTSISPNNERFGFKMSGKFKCAYKLERPVIITGIIIIAVLVVLLVISLIAFSNQFNPDGSIKGGFVDITHEQNDDGSYQYNIQMSNGLVNASLGIVTMEFFGVVLGILLIIYAGIIIFLRAGRYYTFVADENSMTIKFPNGNEESFLYKDVMAVIPEERKFMYGSRGLDITIKTRYRDYSYSLIHTPLSKANGVYETPFNIVRERADLASQWETITKYGRGI